ncbi:MAG TPA: PAS domain S-box protein, partial [Burkholderiaceae bacterium]|nr:PAS domain S-box protein [Burkholderiaceae bacterium]
MRFRQPVDPAQAQAADAPAPQGDAARRGRGRRTERQTHRPTASDADLRLLVETVQDYGIVLLDPDGNVASWNAGAQRIRGYEAAEVIGQPISRLYPAGDPAGPQLESLLQRARDEGRCVFEGWQLRKDGSRFWANVVITALRDDTGALRGYSEITRDRNDRRRLEEMLRSVVDHVVDGIITIDEHGTVESFNPAAERLFKLSRDQIIGRNVNELMPEPFRSGHDEYIRNYTQGGPAKIIGIGREVSGRRADGTTFPMELAVSEFQIASRRFFTGIVRDITQRKQLEHELRQRVDDLAEADRQKNDFLAMLAHELRNPLAPMRNAAHLMKMKGVTVGMAVQAREMLERQLEHLVRLVDDLLDVSRIVQGRIELRREPVDLALVVARAVETAHPVIEARGHRLALDFPERPIYVEGDLIRLAQVIANLLTNAAKYAERPGEICVSAQREAGHAVVRVRDTGIGIAPELLPRIFDLFVQGPQTLVRTQGGLGIGLTLVRRLVELHGGTVSVSSEGNG